MSDYWSQYWERGHLTSFGEKYSGNYQGILKDTWLSFFTGMNEDDNLVDLCTGNGALAFLARELSRIDDAPKITGVDSANLPEMQIDNAKQLDITLLSNIKAEQLPFEQRSVSHVVSQYGLEYTNLTKSLPEIARVLKTGGKFRFACHYHNSAILVENRHILNCCQSLALKGGVLDLLKQLVSELEQVNTGNAGAMRGSDKAEEIRSQLNEGLGQHLQQFGEAFHGTNFPILVQSLFNPQNRHLDKMDMIQSYVEEFDGVVQRLADLDNAALTDENMQEFEQICMANGLKLEERSPLLQPGTGYVAFVYRGIRS